MRPEKFPKPANLAYLTIMSALADVQKTVPKICVIGAGACGLTAAKNFLMGGFEVEVLESHSELGGNWNVANPASSVYESACMISSKTQSEFVDFPMPKSYPPYPNHRQVLEYLQAYATEFGVDQRIEFRKRVQSVAPTAGGWNIWTTDERSPRTYQRLVIANGHHWDPLIPSFAGDFTGQVLHAHEYKSPDLFRERRVLIVGAGNSGCDIAVEAAQHASATFISMRRGYHFLPKFLRGKPIDLCGETLHRWGVPLFLRRLIAAAMVRIAVGPLENYGLPRPDHRLFETHPIINSQLLYALGHGRLQVKPNIAWFDANHVRFADDSSELIDLIVFATGYKLSFPFLGPDSHLVDASGRPNLFLNAFHRQRDDLFVSGLIQPDSGIWGLADLQCRIMANYCRALDRDPPSVAWFKKLKSHAQIDLGHGVKYVNTPRHALEVEYYSYRKRLRKILQRMGDPV